MTLYDFISLDDVGQLIIYWDEGILVGCITKDGRTFECKQIGDFYVEYQIENYRYKDMKCHKNTNLIETYLGSEPLNL